MRKLKSFLSLAVALCALAVPAVAAASPVLHHSEAQLQGERAGWQGKDQLVAFHVTFGDCVKRGQSKAICPNSLWRVHDGIQEMCHQRVVVKKYKSQGSTVLSAKWTFWCGKANPAIPEPQSDPKPPAPQPKQPVYPGP